MSPIFEAAFYFFVTFVLEFEALDAELEMKVLALRLLLDNFWMPCFSEGTISWSLDDNIRPVGSRI